MDVEEGTSNGDGGECSKVPLHCMKSETLTNGFDIGVIHDSGDDVNLGESESCLRTYKRRKRTRSSLERKQPEHDRDYVEVACQLEDKKNGRNVVLEHIYKSFSNDGGLRSCIRDALNQPVTETDANVDRTTGSFKAEQMANNTQAAEEVHAGVIPNGHSVDSTVTEMCQRSFVNVINSEKFTLLCELLTENFQGLKGECVFPLGIMNSRMIEGVYEHSPLLFSTDIQQVWRKIQKIGNDMVSLAQSLTDISRTSYSEQFGCSVPSTLEEEKDELCAQAENPVVEGACEISTCKQCRQKAEERDCLVCDSCEEMYHFSCIVPVLKEIPQKSWYCAKCTTNGIGSPHDNCVLCEKMNAPKAVNNLAEEIRLINEDTFIEVEDNSNSTMDDVVQLSEQTQDLCKCKNCGGDVVDGEKSKICHHSECLHKYYHERCLNMKQLKLYGPNWYCPSCLCRTCLVDEQDHMIVLCDGCDDAYHMYCMSPPLTSVPSGKWFCRKCNIGIQQIRQAKVKYEMMLEKEQKSEEGKKPKGKSKNEPVKKDKENSHLSRGGMDVLLNAVNIEEKMMADNRRK